MAVVIDGRTVADTVYSELTVRMNVLIRKGVRPGLAVVLVGDDPASRIYVNMKKRACERFGLYSEEHKLEAKVPQRELLNLIKRLNADPAIHGILVQLPLPPGFNAGEVINAIDPRKDVDGLHPLNIGKLLIDNTAFIPCTPAGIIKLIEHTGVPMVGKQAVVVGRSNMVGKPAAILLLRENATVTICHSKTANLSEVCRQADILVAAVGKPEIVTGDMVKPGAVVIDVGTNKVGDRQVGDVNFDQVEKVAGYITPVPRGVGPMTIAMLMSNTVEAEERSL
jgi:methylenetetrahydrofolate dehydrogenase (NADP+)/methenyltetrahydrofolate cyclohydrolase